MGNRMKNIIHIKKSGLAAWAALFIIACAIGYDSEAQSPVLVIRPNGKDFKEVIKSLSDDLGNEAKIYETVIEPRINETAIDNAMSKYAPSAIVLMDNNSISYYKKYCKLLPDSAQNIPSISIMGILVGNAISGIENAEAISYEIPIVTSVINLRLLIGTPIQKVGIVHRELMKGLIEQNREACARENINIICRVIPNKAVFLNLPLKKAINELLTDEHVDALWIPNDNILISPAFLTEVWIPQINKFKKPVIVGIEVLASPSLDFGMLAVIPDHNALGVQAASLIINAKENNWKVHTGNVDPSLSVYKILNFKKAHELYNIKKENCNNIDKILE
jgi:hypothetical protein